MIARIAMIDGSRRRCISRAGNGRRPTASSDTLGEVRFVADHRLKADYGLKMQGLGSRSGHRRLDAVRDLDQLTRDLAGSAQHAGFGFHEPR